MAEILHFLLHAADAFVTALHEQLMLAARDAAARNPARAEAFGVMPDAIEGCVLLLIIWVGRRGFTWRRSELPRAEVLAQQPPTAPAPAPEPPPRPRPFSWLSALFSVSAPTEEPRDQKYHQRSDGSWEYRTDMIDKDGNVTAKWVDCAPPPWERSKQRPQFLS